MAIQTGVGLKVAYKKETTFGVLPTNDNTAKYLRRLSSSLGLSKGAIRSEELRSDYQRAEGRHGMRTVGGDLAGELSLGSYADFIASAVRRNFTAVTNIVLSTITASATAPHFVRAAGSWITDGLRVGMVIRMTGWTTTGVNNNSKNFTITALTATGITVAEAVAAKASGDSITLSVPGKVTYAPLTGHTNDSYTIEHWAPDAAQSHRFLGCRVNAVSINLPADAKAGITVGFMGRDRAKAGTQYFSSAVNAPTTPMLTGLSGAMFIAGTPVALVTDAGLTIAGNMATRGVVGDNRSPDVFAGPIDVSGRMSVLFNDGVIDGYFDDETNVSVVLRLNADTLAAGDVLTLTVPKLKFNGGSYQDNPQAMEQQFEWSAAVGDGSAGFEATSLMVQDSVA